MSDKNSGIPLDSLGFGSNLEVMSITDVPDEFTGKVVNFKVEKQNGNITKVKLFVEYNDKLVVISYPQIYLGFVADQLRKMGFIDLSEIKGKTFKFKRMKTTAKLKRKVNYNPRHVPIMLTQGNAEREETQGSNEEEDSGEWVEETAGDTEEEETEKRVETNAEKVRRMIKNK